jgi:hypothetical protein
MVASPAVIGRISNILGGEHPHWLPATSSTSITEQALLHARLILFLLQTLLVKNTARPDLFRFLYIPCLACLYTNHTFPTLLQWSGIGTMKYTAPRSPMPNGSSYMCCANSTRAGSANSFAAHSSKTGTTTTSPTTSSRRALSRVVDSPSRNGTRKMSSASSTSWSRSWTRYLRSKR